MSISLLNCSVGLFLYNLLFSLNISQNIFLSFPTNEFGLTQYFKRIKLFLKTVLYSINLNAKSKILLRYFRKL